MPVAAVAAVVVAVVAVVAVAVAAVTVVVAVPNTSQRLLPLTREATEAATAAGVR
jgi:hypothetical protein